MNRMISSLGEMPGCDSGGNDRELMRLLTLMYGTFGARCRIPSAGSACIAERNCLTLRSAISKSTPFGTPPYPETFCYHQPLWALALRFIIGARFRQSLGII